mmetsp:Transcript_101756/g.247391  ORF Transcript_101756/g.247391 Transcript_101756/m.247391 type:complete len:236 (+) Transcript_101756:232-939(+)
MGYFVRKPLHRMLLCVLRLRVIDPGGARCVRLVDRRRGPRGPRRVPLSHLPHRPVGRRQHQGEARLREGPRDAVGRDGVRCVQAHRFDRRLDVRAVPVRRHQAQGHHHADHPGSRRTVLHLRRQDRQPPQGRPGPGPARYHARVRRDVDLRPRLFLHQDEGHRREHRPQIRQQGVRVVASQGARRASRLLQAVRAVPEEGHPSHGGEHRHPEEPGVPRHRRRSLPRRRARHLRRV